MYNNFLVEKHRKDLQKRSNNDRRLKKWLENYQAKIQPDLVDGYNQRISNFITKVQENPWELEKYEAKDIKLERQQLIKNRLSEMSRKGGRIFRFRDGSDFKSNFTEAERNQRQKNKSAFELKYGDENMAYRSIASQSKYNPSNQFRIRSKDKQINPPMRYSSKNLPLGWVVVQKKNSKSVTKTQNKVLSRTFDGNDGKSGYNRNSTPCSVSFGPNEDEVKSVEFNRSVSDSSRQSNKTSMVRNFQFKQHQKSQMEEVRRNSTGKSYFKGIIGIKQNCNDPHTKKILSNILVRIGKTRPNSRVKEKRSSTQILSAQ